MKIWSKWISAWEMPTHRQHMHTHAHMSTCTHIWVFRHRALNIYSLKTTVFFILKSFLHSPFLSFALVFMCKVTNIWGSRVEVRMGPCGVGRIEKSLPAARTLLPSQHPQVDTWLCRWLSVCTAVPGHPVPSVKVSQLSLSRMQLFGISALVLPL